MNYFLDGAISKLKERVSEILELSAEDSVVIEFANEKFNAHLAVPCFSYAKSLQKSPSDIADILVVGLVENEQFSRVEAVGPYVNLWFKESLLASTFDFAQNSEIIYGTHKANNKLAIIEYVSSNLAKPLSIGHLRNALQGRTLVQLYKALGYTVVTDNHVGDWGTVFGMWVVGFNKFSSDEALEADGVKELGRAYVETRKALKSEEESGGTKLKDEVQEWLQKLEKGDEEALEFNRRFTEISLKDLQRQLDRLDIQFDETLGESFYIKRGKELVEELIEEGQAIRQADSSVIVPLTDEGIELPLLIEKSNGASLYATSDIATLEYREQRWNPNVVVYVVGAEQQLHFDQLFAFAKKTEITDAELIHHWYGLIEETTEDGTRQKMSSRSNAVYLSDLIDRAEEKATELAVEGMSTSDIKIIAHGALSFREFSQGHMNNILFDWDAMFSLQGFSGPYVQYAAVRIGSILAKSEETEHQFSDTYGYTEEVDLLWLLARYPLIVREATLQREGHKIAQYLYDIAKAWNRYYENVQILGAEEADRGARLWLVSQLRDNFEHALSLLGIRVPSKM